MFLIRWLLMAILWVYLPKYSTTDFGLPKGFLANTSHGLCHNSCRICSYFIGSFALSFWQYLALKNFDKAFTVTRRFDGVNPFVWEYEKQIVYSNTIDYLGQKEIFDIIVALRMLTFNYNYYTKGFVAAVQ